MQGFGQACIRARQRVGIDRPRWVQLLANRGSQSSSGDKPADIGRNHVKIDNWTHELAQPLLL